MIEDYVRFLENSRLHTILRAFLFLPPATWKHMTWMHNAKQDENGEGQENQNRPVGLLKTENHWNESEPPKRKECKEKCKRRNNTILHVLKFLTDSLRWTDARMNASTVVNSVRLNSIENSVIFLQSCVTHTLTHELSWIGNRTD